MKGTFLYKMIRDLLLGLACGLCACSNEVLIDRGGHPDAPDPDGKVTLAMTVRVAPLSGVADSDPDVVDKKLGISEAMETKIHSLYVFVFNLGESNYCEAQSFIGNDLVTNSSGLQTFEMKVTPGSKRFYLIANPRFVFRSDLTSYTQAELQELKLTGLKDHSDETGFIEEGVHKDDEIQLAVKNNQGIPMTTSVTGVISLGDPVGGEGDHIYKGNLTLDGSSSGTFTLERAVAKVKLICTVSPEVTNGTLGMTTLEILQANRTSYLLPKYVLSGADWRVDWSAMMAEANLTRTIKYEWGKQERMSDTDWTPYDRGTHYLYENYYGPGLDGEEDGLNDEAKYSRVHIVLTDGRDKTFPLTYLKRNDFLTVTIRILPSNIVCDIRPWNDDVVYPDYK